MLAEVPVATLEDARTQYNTRNRYVKCSFRKAEFLCGNVEDSIGHLSVKASIDHHNWESRYMDIGCED